MVSRVTDRRPVLSSGHPMRSFFEALLPGIFMLSLLAQFGTHLADNLVTSSAATIILICTTAYVLRLQVPAGSWRRQVVYEILAGQTTVQLIGWLLFGFLTLLTPPARLAQLSSANVAWVQDAPLIVLVYTVLLRVSKHTWRYWERMRRKHLVWELTHGHLLLVALAFSLVAVGYVVALSVADPDRAIVSFAIRIAGMASLAGGLFALLSLLAFLPSSIPAYFTSRRITRRLQRLIDAAGALRAGDYQARVQVTGADEIAQLQSDFNAMADHLERALHELQIERDAVSALLKSRRELFAGVSHDLRTPVATLRAYIDSTLEDESAAVPPVLRQDLETMEGEVTHLQHLIDDLFAVARAEVGELEFRVQPTEILPLLQHIVESTSPIAWRTGRVQLIADLPPQLPLVQADVARLGQVLNNLLQNSLRHTPPGGIVVVSARAELGAVAIQVKDTGEGITAADLPHIWERFYRGEGARERHRGGAGLGLALVKKLTETMGGTVAVESEQGRGSCFTVRLLLTD